MISKNVYAGKKMTKKCSLTRIELQSSLNIISNVKKMFNQCELKAFYILKLFLKIPESLH